MKEKIRKIKKYGKISKVEKFLSRAFSFLWLEAK